MIGRYSVRSPPRPFAKLMAVWIDQRESEEVLMGLAAKTASKNVKSASEGRGGPKRTGSFAPDGSRSAAPPRIRLKISRSPLSFRSLGAIRFDAPLSRFAPSSERASPNNPGWLKLEEHSGY